MKFKSISLTIIITCMTLFVISGNWSRSMKSKRKAYDYTARNNIKRTFERTNDLPQSLAFMKFLSCLMAAVSLKLKMFACLKCFVTISIFNRHIKGHTHDDHSVWIRDVNLDSIFTIYFDFHLELKNNINNRQFLFDQYRQNFSSSQ